LARHAKGVSLRVHLHPGARADVIEGLARLADGRHALKAKVTAQPEKGRANRALIDLLAKRWRLPRSSISLLVGTADRHKVLLIEGESGALLATLSKKMSELDGPATD
jgi:uncharacterized protein (TIGR00251 family)